MGKTILLVDDEVEITDIHQRYLVQAGYQVLVAHDGVEALEIFKRKPIDLIITDMHYPMRKGEEGDFDAGEKLLGILKERGIDTKVIICSSLNIKIREAYGCIWYSRISDWEMELLELMNQLKK